MSESYTPGNSTNATDFMAKRSLDSHGSFFISCLERGVSVLDCGCGPGSITIGIAKCVAPGEVVGIDSAESQSRRGAGYLPDGVVPGSIHQTWPHPFQRRNLGFHDSTKASSSSISSICSSISSAVSTVSTVSVLFGHQRILLVSSLRLVRRRLGLSFTLAGREASRQYENYIPVIHQDASRRAPGFPRTLFSKSICSFSHGPKTAPQGPRLKDDKVSYRALKD